MEGRWGRRVFGRIWTEGEYTQFWLCFVLESGRVFTSNSTALTANLRESPGYYKVILNDMTEELSRRVKEYTL